MSLFALGAGLATLTLGRGETPDCGCLGAAGRSKVGFHTVGRSLLLAASCLTAAIANGAVPVSLFLAVGALLLVLSPDLRGSFRAVVGAVTIPCAACIWHGPPTIDDLRTSELWERAADHITEDSHVLRWSSGCWGFAAVPAIYGGRETLAVFAAECGRSPATVAFIDEVDQTTLARFESGSSPLPASIAGALVDG